MIGQELVEWGRVLLCQVSDRFAASCPDVRVGRSRSPQSFFWMQALVARLGRATSCCSAACPCQRFQDQGDLRGRCIKVEEATVQWRLLTHKWMHGERRHTCYYNNTQSVCSLCCKQCSIPQKGAELTTQGRTTETKNLLLVTPSFVFPKTRLMSAFGNTKLGVTRRIFGLISIIGPVYYNNNIIAASSMLAARCTPGWHLDMIQQGSVWTRCQQELGCW